MKSNYSQGWVHLSVNANGLISLWDDKQSAANVQGEEYVRLRLSRPQLNQLDAATRRAVKREKEAR